jgi:hypothetical protein
LRAPRFGELKHGEEELTLIEVRTALGAHAPVGGDRTTNEVVSVTQLQMGSTCV